MASLLERMDVTPNSGSAGPVRNRGGRDGATLPYSGRPHKLGQSKADADNVWKHDMYNGPGKTLSSRLVDAPANPGAVNLATQAIRQALGATSSSRGDGVLSIKGAAIGSNVVQIDNLAKGTTAADVEAIFKRCGAIIESYIHNTPKNGEKVTVRLKFKSGDDAKRAQREFDGKSADGNILTVSVVGSSSTALGGRIAGASSNGIASVDVLMDEDPDVPNGGSKMRSDELLADPRAVVLTAPPGTDPSGRWGRSGRGRRGRGGRRGQGRRGGGMEVD